MTAAIDDFVEEWSQHFKPNECKNFNLEAIKLSEEKQNLPFLKPAQPSSLPYWLMKLRFRFAHQPIL